MSIDYAAEIASELKLPARGVVNTVALLDGEATVPFIARYRKEATQNLDEVQIAAIRDRLDYLRKLADRQQTVLRTIADLGLLTDALRDEIESTRDANKLEDLYLPFRPKRKTRATEAIARGLEPLADFIWNQAPLPEAADALVAPFIDAEKGVADAAAAWQGARDIVAERISELPALRAALREMLLRQGTVTSKVKKGKESRAGKFRDYFDFAESAAKIPSHRLLAIRRGETEGFLAHRLVMDREAALALVRKHAVKEDGGPLADHLLAAAEDAYDRLLTPAIEGQARNELRKHADQEAISVFAKNLRTLLMAPPLGARWVLGVDPGIRTGAKMVALDGKGDLLASTVIDPLKGEKTVEEAAKLVEFYCQRYQIEAIAIGNGTGGREVEAFFRALDREQTNDAHVVLVNEAGASVYSASQVARDEFPDLDVTLRGAISIGRRLQDPLAELVKIYPKSIGVGQYQHDVDQDWLKQSLDDVVESCVNAVGVDLNTASAQLLAYVAGINQTQANEAVKYRAKKGAFTNRRQLLDVPKIGPKTFEQAAGFVRIRGGENPLDASAVHPERYPLVERMAADLGITVVALMGDGERRTKIDLEKYVDGEVGLPTLKDILAELDKPGRDPRDRFDPVRFDPNITEIKHLEEGMVLEGVVTNVTDFGAFVDIGVHQDGLVHLSEMAWRYIDDPSKVTGAGQRVTVKVIGVDKQRKRISLSIKQTQEAPKRPPQEERPPRPPRPPQGDRGPRPPQGDRGPRPPRDDRPPRPREQGDGGRGPRRRDERRPEPIRQEKKPKYDSPFSVLSLENGVIKMRQDPAKKGRDKK